MAETESTVALEDDPPRSAGHFVRLGALRGLAGELQSLAEEIDQLANPLEGVGEPPLVEDIDNAACRVVSDIADVRRFGWSSEPMEEWDER
jgi:hypothetical protein